jgi:hypothetical protein
MVMTWAAMCGSVGSGNQGNNRGDLQMVFGSFGETAGFGGG